jgi:TolA-binding protein
MKFVFKLTLFFLCVFFLQACENSEGSRLILSANNEWIKGRNHSAIEGFKAVLKKYPSGELAEEALFRLGEVYHFSLNNSAQAISYFQEVMELNQNGSFGLEAQKYIAEIMEFTFKDYDQAIIEYQKLIDMFVEEQKNSESQYRIASIYIKKQNYEQAVAELEVLIEKYPNSTRLESAQFKIFENLYTLDRCSEIPKYYKKIMNVYPDSEFGSEMKFIVASCLEEKGMLKEAYDQFQTLKKSYTYPALLEMKLEGLEKRINK